MQLNRSRVIGVLAAASILLGSYAVAHARGKARQSRDLVVRKALRFAKRRPLKALKILKAGNALDNNALMKVLAKNHNYTAGHSNRVGKYSFLIAKQMGLSKSKVAQVHRHGLLHDMGKLLTPKQMLDKPGRLNDREFTRMRRHSGDGAAMLRGLFGRNAKAATTARGHHERPDGQGYPLKLESKEISIEAKIVAVADVYDAMTSQRSYNKPKTKAEAVAILKSIAGKQLDTKAVNAFVKVAKNLPEPNKVAETRARKARLAR